MESESQLSVQQACARRAVIFYADYIFHFKLKCACKVYTKLFAKCEARVVAGVVHGVYHSSQRPLVFVLFQISGFVFYHTLTEFPVITFSLRFDFNTFNGPAVMTVAQVVEVTVIRCSLDHKPYIFRHI